MCFSAKASFIAAGILSTVGAVSTKTALSGNKKLLPLATTPLWFALQQACEGVVWLGLTHQAPPALSTAGIYSFIFFAGCWWPVWIPTVMYHIEHNPYRKKLLLATLIIGIGTAAIYFLGLLFQPAHALIIEHHIYYPTLYSPLNGSNTITEYIENCIPETYLLATVIPFFISSTPLMWTIGTVMGIACLVSQLFYFATHASVWCFFAAIMSVLLCIIIHRQTKRIISS